MRKIRLEIHELSVETFATGDIGAEAEGTVHGQSGFGTRNTSPRDCPSVQTGHEGCFGCAVSGNLSCVFCLADTQTCMASCAATDGESICFYPEC